MDVIRNGGFSIVLDAKELSKGLRPVEEVEKNQGYMSSLSGLVSQDGMLKTLDQMTRIDTSIITDDFPYPQLFVLTDHIFICGKTKIYEYIDSSLELKITVAAGETWKVLDFIKYIVFSNNLVNVVRDANNKTFTESIDFPVSSAMCNYNGQVLIAGS